MDQSTEIKVEICFSFMHFPKYPPDGELVLSLFRLLSKNNIVKRFSGLKSQSQAVTPFILKQKFYCGYCLIKQQEWMMSSVFSFCLTLHVQVEQPLGTTNNSIKYYFGVAGVSFGEATSKSLKSTGCTVGQWRHLVESTACTWICSVDAVRLNGHSEEPEGQTCYKLVAAAELMKALLSHKDKGTKRCWSCCVSVCMCVCIKVSVHTLSHVLHSNMDAGH